MPRPRDDRLISERFSALIVKLRDARQLSLRGAARLIGISHVRLASLEAGIHGSTGLPTLPTPHVIERMASVYTYPREKLLIMAGYIPWLAGEEDVDRLVAWAASELQ